MKRSLEIRVAIYGQKLKKIDNFFFFLTLPSAFSKVENKPQGGKEKKKGEGEEEEGDIT